MRYRVTHRTTYAYDAEVSVSHHLVRVTPRSTPRQQCLRHQIQVTPFPALQADHLDYFGNNVVFLTLEEPHRQLTVTAESDVAVAPTRWPAPENTPPWNLISAQCRENRAGVFEALEFLFASPFVPLGPDFADYARAAFAPERPVLAAAAALLDQIKTDFTFDPRATTVATPVAAVLRERRGVCQDFAHLTLAVLRSLGLPARYVSGYLETVPPPGKPKLVGADASHAWAAVFCPGLGWVGLDPTNNVFPSDRHITAGWGRDYSDVSPLRGVLVGSGHHTLSVGVDVQPWVEGAELSAEPPAAPFS